MEYTRGFLRASESGRHVGVVKYKDASGRWRQRAKTFTADRAESERMLAEWREGLARAGEAQAPAPAPAGGPTVEQAARAALAAQLARGRVERSTHDMQLACAERHLFGELGAVPAASVTPAAAQAWADALCLRTSPGTARIALGVLRKACGRGALEGVEPPARGRPGRACLGEGAAALLGRALDERWGPEEPRALAVRLALMAGLRAGECCALRWRDVDAGRGWVRVAASVGRSASGPYLKGPKCAASERSFPVVAGLAAELAARSAASGPGGPDPAGFVCGRNGGFDDPRALSAAFARLCEAAGVEDDSGRRATFHSLRRTFATRAVRAGVDVRTLADMMGHADASVTLNVYAASGEDAKLAAVARLDALGGNRTST